MSKKIRNFSGRNFRKQRSPDKISKTRRSKVMARVQSKSTAFERDFLVALRKAVKQRYLLNVATLKGKPDIVFSKARVCVFLDSDFWHGWQYPRWKHLLKNDFWRGKISANRARDRKTTAFLKRNGWVVLRFWEHQIKQAKPQCIARIERALAN